MRTVIPNNLLRVLIVLALISCVPFMAAQEVSVPDPGLNAAIREALQKPTGPLTGQDFLGLTNLDAGSRNISSLEGLDAAGNLTTLTLQSNRLANLTIPAALTKLTTVDLGFNPLTNCFFPDGLTNLARIRIESGQLTNLTLPADLTKLMELDLAVNRFNRFSPPASLTALGFVSLRNNQLTTFSLSTNLTELGDLDLEDNQLTSFNLPSPLTNLLFLNLGFNSLTNCVLPNGLTQLETLLLEGNGLASLTLPAGLTRLSELELWGNQLTSLTLPGDMTNLIYLSLFFNQLTNLTLPAELRTLGSLDLDGNQFTSFNVPANLARLGYLNLHANQLTNVTLPAGLTNLTTLYLDENQLTHLILPPGMDRLNFLHLAQNHLTDLELPAGMTNLANLYLQSNRLASLTLPPDLGQLAGLDLRANELTSLTLPPGLTNLVGLFLAANPLATLVLPELLAATSLAGEVTSLRNQGVSVFTFPLSIQLIRLRQPVGAFQFALTGPPGLYAVLASTNLSDWSEMNTVTNRLGAIVFTDVTAHLFPQKFYRAQQQTPPSNMVFIPPNTFTMGSPVSDPDRSVNEGPQTTVTLSRGFWIGKYEVTQGEYLSIMNTNPSQFPGDLSRPISSVSWPDATNYCAKLTQRERAAGRIPAGSYYRLPTEAEWECAARAGTTTRFSYGDDPNYTSLTNYAWIWIFNNDLTAHPVGQKLPNPWGLYDMYGNVWEWCQDWYGSLPGGEVIDPTGPASSSGGWKVMRGGAFDYPNSSCRSASRLFFNSSPFLTDSDLGFRVVLVTEVQ